MSESLQNLARTGEYGDDDPYFYPGGEDAFFSDAVQAALASWDEDQFFSELFFNSAVKLVFKKKF